VLILLGGRAVHDREVVITEARDLAVNEVVCHHPIKSLPIARGSESRLRVALDDLEAKFLKESA
jgi:hypothetical protein